MMLLQQKRLLQQEEKYRKVCEVRMSKNQFVCMLISKYYKADKGELIKFDDGSVITEGMLEKILDAIQEGR